MQQRFIKRAVVQIITIFAVLVALLIAYATFAESRAEQKAKRVCASIPVGTSVSSLIETVSASYALPERGKWRKSTNQNELISANFSGASPFSMHICNIEISENKVVSVDYIHLD